MSGANRIIAAELERKDSKVKSALKSTLSSAYSDKNIMAVRGNEKQPIKKEKK